MNYFVSYKEMGEHLYNRQIHHEGRAEHYGKKVAELEADLVAQLEEADNVSDRMSDKVSNSYTGQTSARDQARNNARSHAQKAVTFKWKYDHLPAEPHFLICESEASIIEFIGSSF